MAYRDLKQQNIKHHNFSSNRKWRTFFAILKKICIFAIEITTKKQHIETEK